MLKLKHALWFAAAIGNMQFSLCGLTHIQGFLRLSDDVGMFYLRTKVFMHWSPLIPRQTWMLRALTCLISVNPVNFPHT